MSPTLRIALAAAVFAFGAAAHAADGWFVRAGATSVNPQSDSGTLAGTLSVDVDSNIQLGLTLGRRFGENWAVELLAATPFSHTASLNGAEAVDFKHLPPTVTLQYYFAPDSSVSPFIGAGVNYTIVYDEKERGPVAGTQVSLDNSWGLAAQAGVAFEINEQWDVVADVRWMDINSDARLNGASIGTVNVDPLVWSVMLGYNF